ncbi:MAG: NAD(+)/NADH kinase [Erysipelotrichaceae bacterium]|jgi:NAD+ kinase
MKKFAIVSKNDTVSIKVARTIQKQLVEGNMEYDEASPDIVCVIGGDGTFLSAIHKYIHRLDKTAFTGIHTGTLGFFADYTLREMKEFVNHILTKVPEIEKRYLLKTVLSNGKIFYSVNEVRVESFKTKVIDVLLNDEKLETLHGLGICVSTQIGSTGYNRSISGAIIQPGLNVLQLKEVAGIHHAHFHSISNPMIFLGSTKIDLISDDFSNTKLCFDRYDFDLDGKLQITCTLSDRYVQIAHYKPHNWIDNLKQLF